MGLEISKTELACLGALWLVYLPIQAPHLLKSGWGKYQYHRKRRMYEKPPRLESRESSLTMPLGEPMKRKRKRKKRSEDRRKDERPPRVKMRGKMRSGEPSKRKRKAMVYDQNESLWFRLPREIRDMIYEEYIVGKKGKKIWIVITNGILEAYKGDAMEWERRERLWFRDLAFDEPTDSLQMEFGRMFRQPGRFDVTPGLDVLPLMQSCRRIYGETAELLYALPEFTFVDPLSFLAFSSSIIPQRFNCVRTVSFHIDTYHTPMLLPTPPGTNNSMKERLTYKSLHTSYWGRFYNPCLTEARRKDNRVFWDAIIEILGGMEGLKDLVALVNNERTIPVEDLNGVGVGKLGERGVRIVVAVPEGRRWVKERENYWGQWVDRRNYGGPQGTRLHRMPAQIMNERLMRERQRLASLQVQQN